MSEENTSLIEAISTAERIASLLIAGLGGQAHEEYARYETRAPLVEEYQRRLADEGRDSTSKPFVLLKGLIGALAKADRDPQPCYAPLIRGYCADLRQHFGTPTGRWSEPMRKSQAAKELKITPRTLRRWLDDPSKSPRKIKEVNQQMVRIYLEE